MAENLAMDVEKGHELLSSELVFKLGLKTNPIQINNFHLLFSDGPMGDIYRERVPVYAEFKSLFPEIEKEVKDYVNRHYNGHAEMPKPISSMMMAYSILNRLDPKLSSKNDFQI